MFYKITRLMEKSLYEIHKEVIGGESKIEVLESYGISPFIFDKLLRPISFKSRGLQYTDLKYLPTQDASIIFGENYRLPLKEWLFFTSSMEQDYLFSSLKYRELYGIGSYCYPAMDLTAAKVKALNNYLSQRGCLVNFNLVTVNEINHIAINSLDYELLQAFLRMEQEAFTLPLLSCNDRRLNFVTYSSLNFFTPAEKLAEEKLSPSCVM